MSVPPVKRWSVFVFSSRRRTMARRRNLRLRRRLPDQMRLPSRRGAHRNHVRTRMHRCWDSSGLRGCRRFFQSNYWSPLVRFK